MKQGDILLMYHKIDPFAWILQWLTKGRYNHVSWAINDHEIIECVGKGIIITSINKFMTWRWGLKLIRLQGLSQEKIKRITKRLLKKQCRYNYIKYLFNFIIMIIRRKTHRPTCSNLVSYELIKEGYYIAKKHPKVIVPEDYNVFKQGIDVTDELWS
jgi:hypothetical protein